MTENIPQIRKFSGLEFLHMVPYGAQRDTCLSTIEPSLTVRKSEEVQVPGPRH